MSKSSKRPARPVGKPPRPHAGGRRGGPPSKVLLYGMHAVRAALANPERKLSTLHATANALARLGDLPDVAIDTVETGVLDRMVGRDAVHQGLVLACSPLEPIDGSELFRLAEMRFVLVLDQITDPHNVGAILRSAVALGVECVLVTARNAAPETGVLAKSASGALDMIEIAEVRNLSGALADLKEFGFFTIGLDSEGPADLRPTLADCPGTRIAIVLGAEGRGLREKTRDTCDALARLDMPGAIKSLNVSNAAALALYLARARLDDQSSKPR